MINPLGACQGTHPLTLHPYTCIYIRMFSTIKGSVICHSLCLFPLSSNTLSARVSLHRTVGVRGDGALAVILYGDDARHRDTAAVLRQKDSRGEDKVRSPSSSPYRLPFATLESQGKWRPRRTAGTGAAPARRTLAQAHRGPGLAVRRCGPGLPARERLRPCACVSSGADAATAWRYRHAGAAPTPS